jgi:hypothetical protein
MGRSSVASAQIMPNEKKESAAAFLTAALAYYQSLGITVARVMTDNGSCYRAFDFRDLCRDLGLKHIRTKTQQVVLGEGEAAYGRLEFYPAVWSMPVISVQPGGQLLGASV